MMLQFNFFMSFLGTFLLSIMHKHGMPSNPFSVTLLNNNFLIPVEEFNTFLVKCVCVCVGSGGGQNCTERDPREKTVQTCKAKVKRYQATVNRQKCKINLISFLIIRT